MTQDANVDVVVSAPAPAPARKQRANPTWTDFLRVSVVERAKFPTVKEAADALGMSQASYQQKMTKAKKRFPDVFKDVPNYKGETGGGPRVPTQAEIQAIMESLRAASAAQPTEPVTPPTEGAE